MLARVLAARKEAPEVAARSLEARARRRRAVAAHHGAAGPRHRHRLHRDLLRAAVTGRACRGSCSR